jgi:hypothetical protein
VKQAATLPPDLSTRGISCSPAWVAQPGEQALVTPMAELAVEQQSEPFGMAQCGCFGGGFDIAEGLGHAGEAELMQQLKRRMGERGRIS